MEDISSFLKKFRLLVKDGSEQKKMVAGVLKPFCSCDILPSEIDFRQRRIYLKTNRTQPADKNNIFLNKKEIIEKINKETGLSFEDIGF